MAITLFPNAQKIALTEDDKANPHKSSYENYTGIVFDTDKNEFKIVTGKFRDKKDMYEKMTKEEKYLRRAYESKIWDWIQDNAKTPVDGYLMLSTAVSKWINNNVLSKYYKKLLHDLPYINREGRKGDPQTMGTKASFESMEETEEDKMLNEAIMNEADLDDKYDELYQIDKNDENKSKHTVDIYGVDDEGKRGRLLISYPNVYLFDNFLDGSYADALNVTNEKLKNKARIFSPSFITAVYNNMKTRLKQDQGIKPGELSPDSYNNQNLIFVVDKNLSDPIYLKKSDIGNMFASMYNNHYDWDPFKVITKGKDDQIAQIDRAYQAGKITKDKYNRLKNVTGADTKLPNEIIKKIIPLKTERDKLNKMISAPDKDWDEFIKLFGDEENPLPKAKARVHELTKQILELENQGRLQNISSNKKENDFNREYNLNKPISIGNPLHNSNYENDFVNRIDQKLKFKNNIVNQIKNYEQQGNYKRASELRKLLGEKPDILSTIHDTEILDRFKNKASNAVNRWNASKEIKPIERTTKRHEEIINDLASKTGANIYLLKRAAHAVLTNKGIELKKEKPQFFDRSLAGRTYADPVNAAIDYFDKNRVHDNEFIQDLNKEYIKLKKFLGTDAKLPDDTIKKIIPLKKEIDKLNTLIRTSDLDGLRLEFGDDVENPMDVAKEKINELNKEMNELRQQNKNESVVDEAQVNDGATELMQQTDKIAQNIQKNAMTEDNTHSELNPELFENEKLKDDIRDALIKIADTFKEKLKLPFEPVDVYFTGSEANYNYNENSDIDLHLVYDFENAGVSAEILNKYLQSAKRVFNDEHDILIKNIPVEVGAENLAEPLTTSGVYSLVSNDWVIKPQYANVEIEEPEKSNLDEVRNIIEDVISSQNRNEIENMIKLVWDMRKNGLKEEGEFGPSNTLFKILRNDGILARLKDAYYASESRDLSLESIMKEDYFGNRDEIFTVEDDLINKSEQEIYDGLMDHYKGNENEALAKLEDVLKTCDDGYKDKIHDVMRKIKENTSFENKCNRIIENSMSKLEEYGKKDPLEGSENPAHVDLKEPIAEINEMLRFCREGIHPNIKEAHVPFRYTDNNGNVKGITLLGIEKGDDPQNVCVQEIGNVRDPNNSYRRLRTYGEKQWMPISKFLEIINSEENKKMYDSIIHSSKYPDMSLDQWVDYLTNKKEAIINRYNNWFKAHEDEYDLNKYTWKARHDIYDKIINKKWRPDLALAQHKKIDDWRNKLPKKEESTLDEAGAQDYWKVTDGQKGRYIVNLLESMGISPEFISVPFGISVAKNTDQSKKTSWAKHKQAQNPNTPEDQSYKYDFFIIKGIDKPEKEKDIEEYKEPENIWVQRLTEEGEAIKTALKPFAMSTHKVKLAMLNPINDPTAVDERAFNQMFNPQGAKRQTGRTWKEGEYQSIVLTDEEIRAVLKQVEERYRKEERMFKAIRGQTIDDHKLDKDLISIYESNPDDPRIINALKAFDEDTLHCVRKVQTSSGPTYRLWLPYPNGSVNPPMHYAKNNFLKMVNADTSY